MVLTRSWLFQKIVQKCLKWSRSSQKKNLQVAVKIPIYLQIYKEEGGITKYQYKGKNLASWVSLIVVYYINYKQYNLTALSGWSFYLFLSTKGMYISRWTDPGIRSSYCSSTWACSPSLSSHSYSVICKPMLSQKTHTFTLEVLICE